MELTLAQIQEYTRTNNNAKRWKCYAESVQLYDALRIHANGEYPRGLIDERRPAESVEIKNYRKKIFVPYTKSTFSKIITSLSKIRKASDWVIKYDSTSVPPAIAEGESPENYFEEDFPYFKSLTNWMFNAGLKNYLIDANAVVVVMPLETELAPSAYLRPFPFIFTSDLVYDFEEEEFCVLYSTDKATYKTDNTNNYDGDIYYVITDERIQRYDQINSKGDLQLMADYVHELGYMPAFRMKGVFKKALDKTFMWESRIASIVPHLDEATREYSDLQAEVVQHIHSTMWIYATQDCRECSGIGKVQREGRTVECDVCKGQGKVNVSPYSHVVIKPADIGQGQVPTPPMGYVQKQVEIVKIQDQRIDDHIYKGLAAINMEFLAEAPLNQSGTAKEVDRDELNVFVNSIASDVVNIMQQIYKIGIEYRYRVIVPNTAARKDLLPQLNIPEKFDLLSSNVLITEIQSAKTGKVDPSIVNELEIEFATKKFTGEPDIQAMVRLTLMLDPFPGLIDDDKMTRMSNGGISKVDYVISCNIHQFVKRAISEVENFVSMDYEKQCEQLQEYAQEIIDTNDAAAKVKMKMMQTAMGNPSVSGEDDLVNGDNQDKGTANADSYDGKQDPAIDQTPNPPANTPA